MIIFPGSGRNSEHSPTEKCVQFGLFELENSIGFWIGIYAIFFQAFLFFSFLLSPFSLFSLSSFRHLWFLMSFLRSWRRGSFGVWSKVDSRRAAAISERSRWTASWKVMGSGKKERRYVEVN